MDRTNSGGYFEFDGGFATYGPLEESYVVYASAPSYHDGAEVAVNRGTDSTQGSSSSRTSGNAHARWYADAYTDTRVARPVKA